MTETSTHHESTRVIYHKQHNRLNADDTARSRIHSMYTEEYFGLGDRWFEGKSVLDAGCGNMAVLLIKLASFGASPAVGLDLSTEWIQDAELELKRYGIPASQYQLVSGSVTDLPFNNEQFDFVACNGVLVHLENMNEVRQAFTELARTTKKDGYLYVSGGTVGGLSEGVIFPALREHYAQNEDFRRFIDVIRPEIFHEIIKKIATDMRKFTGESFDSEKIIPLFDEDLCVFLQNALQPPSRLHREFNSECILQLFNESGFKEPVRLKRFVKRANLRKFFAPLHYDRDHPVSKVLYGEGSVEYIAQKI